MPKWMHLCFASALLLVLISSTQVAAQRLYRAQDSPESHWATQAISVLTCGQQVTSISASLNVVRLPDQDNGAKVPRTRGSTDSRRDLSTITGDKSAVHRYQSIRRVDRRPRRSGFPHPYTQHNCWTDGLAFSSIDDAPLGQQFLNIEKNEVAHNVS